MEAIREISQAPPAPTWLFTPRRCGWRRCACRCSSASGIWPRWRSSWPAPRPVRFCVRTLAHYTTNALLQPLGAALLAGVVGALAVRYRLSSSLRLVAVCPCHDPGAGGRMCSTA